MTLEVYPCGIEVALTRSVHIGVIIGISIRDTRVIYEVSYYEAGTYESTWLCDYEFTVSVPCAKAVIGFKGA